MQSILLHHFKSYEHQAITNLNSRINIVLGSNGQGKSNFFKAISFLLTDKYTLNRAEFNGTLHRGANATEPELVVEAHFNNQEQENKTYKLSKSWNNQNIEDFKINDKSRTKAEFENFIESFGLSYASPYNIVQQGKIALISQMNQNQLYLLLEDTAGVKRFMKRSEEARNNLEKIQADLNEVEEDLKFLKDKVGHVEDRKNEYELFAVEEKIRKIKTKRELINSIATSDTNIKKMKEKHLLIMKEIEQNKMREYNINQEIVDRQQKIKILSEKSYFYERQESDIVEETNIFAKKSVSAKKKELKQLEKKIANEQKVLQQNQIKLNVLEKQFSSYREKYDIMKMDFELQGESKDQKKIKQAYEAKIQTEKQAIKNTQQELKKLAKIRENYKMVNYSSETKELQSLEAELTPVLEQLKKLRIHLIELARNKMNAECQIQTILAKKKIQDDLVKKIMPMVDLRLKSWLEENKIEGVYGYLIEHLKIDKDVAFAYELAGLSRLCTLLVQNDQVATKVIEINKKIHGKNINILPLSYIKTQALEKRAYPKAQNVFSLINSDWIKIGNSQKFASDTKSVIQKVVNNTFSRYALVEDYTTALKVSKEYNLNCITADREIVFADAYMCKVGREQTFDKGKIEHFESLQSLTQELALKKVALASIERKQVELQNQEIQLTNKQEKFDLKINQLQKTIDDAKKIESLIQKLQAKQASLQQSIQRNSRAIQQFEASIKNLQNNNKSKFRPEDFKKAETQYFAHKTKVQKLFEQNYERQKAISSLLKELEIVKKEVNNLEKKDSSLPELESKENILKNLDDSRRKYEEEITNLGKELGATIEKRSEMRQKQAEILTELTFEEANQKEIKAKIQAMADVNPQEQQQIQELSNTISSRLNPDSLANRKRSIYTARDKVFFSKIMSYVDKVNYFKEATKQISQERDRLLKYVEETEREASRHMKNFVINFEKQFIHYFLRFVPNGKAELKTRVYTHKVKGITKNGYSLEVKVCFNEDEGIRKWSEFSGGQKTVLSLCIILAIQKCQPTPFCVFDEVDAALDPFYAKKLVDIIIQESKNCQYFITSFKKSMLDFPEEIANYYLVKTVDRVSNITLVEKQEVEDFIEKLAE